MFTIYLLFVKFILALTYQDNIYNIIFQATQSCKSLNHCKTVIQAQHGEKGYNKDCNGKNAQHAIVPVPIGELHEFLSQLSMFQFLIT